MSAGNRIAAVASGLALLTTAVTATAQSEKPDPAKIEKGEQVYADYCQVCHGDNLVSSGQTFDLRKLEPKERQRFQNAVEKGKGQMPPWKGVIDDGQIDAIWSYVMSRRN